MSQRRADAGLFYIGLPVYSTTGAVRLPRARGSSTHSGGLRGSHALMSRRSLAPPHPDLCSAFLRLHNGFLPTFANTPSAAMSLAAHMAMHKAILANEARRGA